MLDDQGILGLEIISLVFITAATIRTVCASAVRFRLGGRRRHHGTVGLAPYRDEDGASTASSTIKLALRTPGVPIVMAAAMGLFCSVANATWIYLGSEWSIWSAEWFFLVAWCMIFTQALHVFVEGSSVKRYNAGTWAGLSCLVLILASSFDAYYRVALHDGVSIHAVFLAFTASEIILGIVIFVLAISIQRRPDVFKDGQLVDAQYTGSAFQRYTFGWVRPLLNHAREHERLEYNDLPGLDHLTRSKDTSARFNSTSISTNGSLWYLVYRDHKKTFILQWVLTVIESIFYHSPSYFLFKIIRSVENSTSSMTNSNTWFLVGGLGFALLGHLFIDSWIDWISFARLAIPIRGQLSALIFEKSLHVKNVKTAPKREDVGTPSKDDGLRSKETISDEEDDAFEMESLLSEDSSNHAKNERQKEVASNIQDKKDKSNESRGILNLLGVDAQRVADFTGYNNLVPGALIKVIIAIAFLVRLTGWLSVLAGLLVPLVFIPFNSMSTKKYAYYQGTVMKARDVKAKIAAEALHGIRQIKFSATESQWQDLIMKAREAELKELWSSFVWACLMLFCWFSMPIILGGVVLGLHAWLNGGIQASVAFTALAIFGKLEWCLSVVPLTITDFYDAKVSIGRIENHLDSAETEKTTQHGELISFNMASIRWPCEGDDDTLFTMRDLNLKFPPGGLSVICGKTGSGKGLLLAAIIGEADIIEGDIFVPDAKMAQPRNDNRLNDKWIVPSTMAYVAQIPWIENATIKDNILFGLPFDAGRFQKVVYSCALIPDLSMLPDGELTEIGDKGINLSGGQRWRVTLARALYSHAEILIMDDIFSAVDAHVGRHILQHALLGELARGRTRILATHHTGLVLPFATYGVFLGDGGSVLRAGPVGNETRGLGSPGPEFYMAVEAGDNNGEPERSEQASQKPTAAKNFVEEEKRERGQIKWSTYKAYVEASGGFFPWFWTLSFFILLPASIFGRSWLVKSWSEAFVGSDPNSVLPFYLILYLCISLFSALVVSIKVILVCIVAIRASRKLFEDLTHAVLRAPLRWLDTVPSGRILNRLVGDFAMVDAKFPSDFIYSATSFLSLLAVIIAAVIVTPIMILPFMILGILCIYSAILFLAGAREMKRLESTSKSPIFDLYGSVLAGLDTIRSFDKTNEYRQRMFSRIDRYSQSSWYLWLATRWLSFRMGVIGSSFALTVAALVLTSTTIGAALAGFALSYALEYSATVVQSIRRYTGVELDMNCTERIVEYANMPTEPKSGAKVHANWPYEGSISVHNLEVGYARDLPSVLKGLTFSVKPGKRVGIVGRTGSGKSSLALAIFRFLEARRGSIIIDGQDISNIRLHDLRSRISIIPQDPVLFSGTLRSNLDIFGRYSDEVLKNALRRVHLIEDNKSKSKSAEEASSRTPHKNIPLDLDSTISDGGLNLSQGQRQLLCLARAIVTQPKMLILDEATSAVDMDTDELIQRSIRESFSHCTMLVIAHRLSTVADFDSVLVMDNGRALEYDAPQTLFAARGAFYAMAQESRELEKLQALIEHK